MATITLAGKGAVAVTGRAPLVETLALSGRGGIAVTGRAAASTTISLRGKGTIAVTGREIDSAVFERASVVAWHLNPNGSLTNLGPVTLYTAASWSEQISEPGAGTITIQNDAPILASLSFDGWDLIQFLIDGIPAFVMVPDPAQIVTVSQSDEAGETTTLSGPGLLGLLDRMRVYPNGGVGRLPKETDRFFNWSTLDFDITGYPAAKEILDVGTAKVSWPEPWADDYPLDICQIIWMDNGASTSTYLDADEGTCWFWYDFTAPEEGVYRMFVATDNDGDCYIDGQLILSSDSFVTTQQADFTMTAGAHRVAMRVHNGAWLPGNPSGPAGIALSIALVTLAGPTLLLYTFDGFSALAYEDDPPGVTPGYAYGLALDEGIARNVLPGLTRDWTALVDTYGHGWSEVADVSTPVNGSMLDFTRELAGTYMDVRMSPHLAQDGLKLQAYILGEMGGATGKTLVKGSNLTSLEHRRENLPVTTLLVQAVDRWIERTDASSEAAYGRSESSLDAGSPNSVAEVNRIADGQLDIFAHPREEISAGFHDDNLVPYVHLHLGETVTVPDSTGVSAVERCVGLAVTVEPNTNRAVFTCSFRDVILGDEERLIVIAKQK